MRLKLNHRFDPSKIAQPYGTTRVMIFIQISNETLALENRAVVGRVDIANPTRIQGGISAPSPCTILRAVVCGVRIANAALVKCRAASPSPRAILSTIIRPIGLTDTALIQSCASAPRASTILSAVVRRI